MLQGRGKAGLQWWVPQTPSLFLYHYLSITVLFSIWTTVSLLPSPVSLTGKMLARSVPLSRRQKLISSCRLNLIFVRCALRTESGIWSWYIQNQSGVNQALKTGRAGGSWRGAVGGWHWRRAVTLDINYTSSCPVRCICQSGYLPRSAYISVAGERATLEFYGKQ